MERRVSAECMFPIIKCTRLHFREAVVGRQCVDSDRCRCVRGSCAANAKDASAAQDVGRSETGAHFRHCARQARKKCANVKQRRFVLDVDGHLRAINNVIPESDLPLTLGLIVQTSLGPHQRYALPQCKRRELWVPGSHAAGRQRQSVGSSFWPRGRTLARSYLFLPEARGRAPAHTNDRAQEWRARRRDAALRCRLSRVERTDENAAGP